MDELKPKGPVVEAIVEADQAPKWKTTYIGGLSFPSDEDARMLETYRRLMVERSHQMMLDALQGKAPPAVPHVALWRQRLASWIVRNVVERLDPEVY